MSDSLTNWAGMEIRIGSVVWRGAREGNTSSFKIGVVERVNAEKRTAKVSWLFKQANWTHWVIRQYLTPDRYEHLLLISHMSGSGSPTIDSLALIDVDLQKFDDICREWHSLSEEAIRLRDSGAPTLDKRG